MQQVAVLVRVLWYVEEPIIVRAGARGSRAHRLRVAQRQRAALLRLIQCSVVRCATFDDVPLSA